MVALASGMMLRTMILGAAIAQPTCAPGDGSKGRVATATSEAGRAARVPTLVLTEARAGTTLVAEAGDRIEVRLAAPDASDRWKLVSRSGDVVRFIDERLETGRDPAGKATPFQVFRFSAAAAGRAELVFGRGARSLKFVIEVR